VDRTQAEASAYRQGALDVVEALAAGLEHLAAALDGDPLAAEQARSAATTVRLMRGAVDAVTSSGKLLRLDDQLAGEPTAWLHQQRGGGT
jgi:hypothetical protein